MQPMWRLDFTHFICVPGDKGDSTGCPGPSGDRGPSGDTGPSGDDLLFVDTRTVHRSVTKGTSMFQFKCLKCKASEVAASTWCQFYD